MDPEDQWLSLCHSGESSLSEDGWTRGAVWKGGEALARELLAHPELVRGLRVVEVGTGTGIVGLAAAAAGAGTVTLTDQSLDAAQTTLRMNPSLADRISLRKLRWGDEASGSALTPPFEVIIASDVIHPQNAEAVVPLLKSVRTLAGASGGSRVPFVLLSCTPLPAPDACAPATADRLCGSRQTSSGRQSSRASSARRWPRCPPAAAAALSAGRCGSTSLTCGRTGRRALAAPTRQQRAEQGTAEGPSPMANPGGSYPAFADRSTTSSEPSKGPCVW